MAKNDARDWEIFRRKARGEPVDVLAAEYGITVNRIHQIIQKERGKLPRATAEDYRKDFADELDAMRVELRKLIDAGPVPAFSSKGDQLWARDSPSDAELRRVDDHSGRLAAMAQLVQVQARAAKLLGLDAVERAAVEQTVRYIVDGAEDV